MDDLEAIRAELAEEASGPEEKEILFSLLDKAWEALEKGATPIVKEEFDNLLAGLLKDVEGKADKLLLSAAYIMQRSWQKERQS